MPKKFLGQFFLLSAILLFSCENNTSCIDAEDYGNIEKEIIKVSASPSEVCYNNIKPNSYKADYADIPPIFTSMPEKEGVKPNALIECLTKKDIRLIESDVASLRDIIVAEPSYKMGCLGINDPTNRQLCEAICESECVKENAILISANAVIKVPWKANTPREKDSNIGINIVRDKAIFVNAEGEVNFDKAYGSGVSPTDPSSNLSLFKGNQVVKLEFSGSYEGFNASQYFYDILASQTISKTAIEGMQGLARRSLFFFTPTSQSNSDIIISTDDLNKVKNSLKEISLPNADSNGIITYSLTEDGLINFKIDTNLDCEDAKIDVSIIKNLDNENDKIIDYKVTNLKLSTAYTTKNIPAYSGAILKIKIGVENNAPQSSSPVSCSIKMQTQKYLDIPITNSGIAQFKALASTCRLYGRIINPGADKMIYPAKTDTEIVGISHNGDSDKVFIVSRGNGFNKTDPLGTGVAYKVKNVYIGLNAYANKYRKDLAGSSCRQQQVFPNCKIESSSCSITSNDMSQVIDPNGCNNGSGIDGSISPNKAGNGGGGGGNVAGSAGSYKIEDYAGGSGKNGQSYINPEFQFGAIDTPTRPSTPENLNIGAPSSSASKGGDGYVIIWLEGDADIDKKKYSINTPDLTYTIPQYTTKKLNYEIYGGGGGAGGNCDTKNGGSGKNGDYFLGELDISSSATISALTLNIQVGSGGYSGKNCGESLESQSNKSKNLDANKKLKGGNGGINNENVASGGAGGSASYISLKRIDETDDANREDFLVIAGGGGGGGGAYGIINGRSADDTYNRNDINKLESSANGLRLAIALESIPNINTGFSSNYYEYDDFFTKTVLSSVDPLKNIDLTTNYGETFFVRKGQTLRILPKSFENKCDEGMSIKITPRPAVLCLKGIEEDNFPNPSCIPYIKDFGTRYEIQGCMAISACEKIEANDYCPNPEECAKITCTPGSDTLPNTGCTRATPPSSCAGTCLECSQKKIAQMQSPPKIKINTSICYQFENSNISVHKFLNEYNAPTTDQDKKKNLVKNIKKIENYDDITNFGNFNDYVKSSKNPTFFETKNLISFPSGKVESFLIKNDNFTDISKVMPTGSEIVVRIVNTKIQQKGKGLQVALCKEIDKPIENPINSCSSEEPTILAYFIKDPENVENNAFKFNSFGILERVRGLKPEDSIKPGIAITDCPGMAVGDNFICFNTTEPPEEINKYRLIFKVDDKDNNYSNNAGEYNIKVEAKGSSAASSGGLINGILQPIIENLDGKKDNPATTTINESEPGIVRNFYILLINNPLYKTLVTLTIVLALSFYGMGYLIGVNELKHSEVVKILLKIGFIYLFTSTSTGWSWFNKFFVEIFKNATDYISFSVAETFDYENSNELKLRIKDSNFYDRGILFKSVDAVIDLILAGAVQKKIMALLFSSIFGWLYFLILYYCLFTYVYAVANSMLLYITCQIIISILFVLGPIFFIFLMFKVTKDMFDNWLKALIGFSLQQIFLLMTLALFNSFVVGFLKLALGYRVCWTNILSLNLYVNRVTLLNFWTVAGTNSPENSIEDSPDETFGNEQNMPSIYLFLYLMIIVSLMSKFIELFTNLAVSLAGGLKASSIAADSVAMGKSILKAASSAASVLYKKTAGRVVSRIDDTLFDSGKIASERRKAERQQFTNDVKTRVALNKEGNKAVSEYKKKNALTLSEMSADKQKEKLRGVKQDAIKKYADSNGIGSKEIDRITNASGLNYSGNNLIGMVFQAGKQAVIPGGSLVNSMNNKKIDASFSKSEANSALKRMNSDERENFIKAVEGGDIHVNKGKIENARKMAITAVKAPVKAFFNPKATVISAVKAIGSAGYSGLEAIHKQLPIIGEKSKLKNEVIKNLEDTGKITKNQNPLPGLLTEWTRTDEEKLKIKNAVREKSTQEEVSLQKLTSKSVIQDLKGNKNYFEKTEEITGVKFSNKKSPTAMANRALERMGNLFEKGESRIEKSKRVAEMHQQNFDKLNNEGNSRAITNESLKAKRDSLILNDKKIKTKEEYKKFAILEEARNSIIDKGNRTASIRDDVQKEMRANGMGDIVDKLNKPAKFWGVTLGGLPSKNQLTKYLDKLIEKEVSKNPELFENIRENRFRVKEIDIELGEANKKKATIKNFEEDFNKAVKINEASMSPVKDYKDNNSGLARGAYATASKVSSITAARPIFRNANFLAKGARNSFKSFRKMEKIDEEVLTFKHEGFEERERFKKANSVLRDFKEIKNPKGFKNFVEANKKIYNSILSAEPPKPNSGSPLSTTANQGGNNAYAK